MNEKRYNIYEEGSELLWPKEKKDKITRNFYRYLSHLSKNKTHGKIKKFSFIKQIIRMVWVTRGF